MVIANGPDTGVAKGPADNNSEPFAGLHACAKPLLGAKKQTHFEPAKRFALTWRQPHFLKTNLVPLNGA